MKLKITHIMHIFVLMYFIAFAYSCEKTVTTINLEEKSPKLVLNGFINPDSTLRVYITSSQDILSEDPVKQIENGIVEIFDKETKIANLENEKDGFYFSEVNELNPSTEYTIKVNAPGYNEVSNSFSIPKKIKILSVDTSSMDYFYNFDRDYPQIVKKHSFKITFKTPEKQVNHYIIKAFIKAMYISTIFEDTTKNIFPIYIFTNEPSSDLGIDFGGRVYNKFENYVAGRHGICFSETLEPNKTKTISIESINPTINSEGIMAVYIIFENISTDYYLYLKSLAKYQSIADYPKAQKVNVFSNINGGFGFIGTYSQSIDSIIFKED